MITTSLNPVQAGNSVAILAIGTVQLVLPQVDIRSLEAAADIDPQDPQPNSTGWIVFLQQRWPVYCLSVNLQLMHTIPLDRRACIVMATAGGYLGILCDAVQIAKQLELGTPQEIPTVMRQPHTPVQGLISINAQHVGCLTNARQLVAHVNRQAAVA